MVFFSDAVFAIAMTLLTGAGFVLHRWLTTRGWRRAA